MPTFRRIARILFWAALVFALMMALLPKPPQLPGDPGDKLQHVLAFSVLSALAATAYPAVSLVRIGLLLSAYGALIELLQTIQYLHRDGNLIDWLADSAAIATVLLLVRVVRRHAGR